jgi:hypothetical protein
MPKFNVGDRVRRIENREVTAATVLSVQESGDRVSVEISYDEGGSGWWPEDCLEALVEAPVPTPEPEQA